MVLVHGGFADTSVWAAVVAQLEEEGVPVTAVPIPMRALSRDADKIAESIANVTRDSAGGVLLVGHAYGGAVISSAAARVDRAVGLVFIAGYALDIDESVLDIALRFPHTALPSALRPAVDLVDSIHDKEVILDPSAFATIFAADMSAAAAAALTASQGPVGVGCLTQPARAAAWRALPSWYLIAKDDRCISPDSQRFMASRADSHTLETAGSHAVVLSQPTAVVDIVLTAVHVLR
jgi:pimeloyl-ACP methyl ester carboxylesterase